MRRGEGPLSKYKSAPGLAKQSLNISRMSSASHISLTRPKTASGVRSYTSVASTRPKTASGVRSTTPAKTARRPQSALPGTRRPQSATGRPRSSSTIEEYPLELSSRSATLHRPKTSSGVRPKSATQSASPRRPKTAYGTSRDREPIPNRLMRAVSAMNVRPTPIQYNNSYIPSTLSYDTERRFKNLRKGK